MTTPLSTVLQSLPGLSSEALVEVRNKATALLALGGGGIAEKTDGGVDYILEGIYCELRSRGIIGQLTRLPEREWPSTYKAKSKEVRAFFESKFPTSLTTPKLMLLGRLIADALARHITNNPKNIPLSIKTMMARVDQAPSALNETLPDYLGSGMLLFVLERNLVA